MVSLQRTDATAQVPVRGIIEGLGHAATVLVNEQDPQAVALRSTVLASGKNTVVVLDNGLDDDDDVLNAAAMPTSQPSRQPTSQPTSQPTGQPSFHPTLHGTVIRDIDPSTMSKSTGFRIKGSSDSTGFSVSKAGDVNGDGIDDMIIASPFEPIAGLTNVGIAYVVFGRNRTISSDFNMATMTTGRSTGFRLLGSATNDFTGAAVGAAGDFNGDGVDDILVNQNLASHAGITYVIFGRRVASTANAFTDITLSSYASSPTTMIRIFGVTAGDYSGAALSGGADINGDGIHDIIVGAGFATPATGRENAGISYVIFGTKSPSDIYLSAIVTGATIGFRILGVASGDHSGSSVGSADVNGDGIKDVLLGAYLADASTSLVDSGVVYVLFGSKLTGARSDVELSTMTSPAGFRINGANGGDGLGVRLSGAGDVNGDGAEDIVIGAFLANPSVSGNVRTAAGVAYVLFGRKTSSLPINLSSGIGTTNAPGFQILGAAAGDWMGFAVSGAGDLNDDGYADVVVGAQKASVANGVATMGVSYVIFGHAGTLTTVDLLTMKAGGSTGFRVLGTTSTASVQSGYALSSAGDVNGDGVTDLLVGPASYVIYGGNFWSAPTSQPSTQPSSQPSRRPSAQPSRQPTGQPSCQPTRRPSSQPTAQPSRQPSSQPVSLPSSQPSSQPSRQPSSQPSSHPSRQPTSQPSSQPTQRPSHRQKEIQDIVIGSSPLSKGIFMSYNVYSVSSAGDVNGDGISDMIVGNPNAFVASVQSGMAFVLFGRNASFARNLDLANMVTGRYTGFRILGAANGDNCGYSVSGAGDVNGDGVDDVIVGALTASPPTLSQGGISYVIFGRRVTSDANSIANVNLATLATSATTLFRIYAAQGGDSSGSSVSGAGDINGDGKADVIVGSIYASAGTGRQNGGVAYVIFGTASPVDVYLASVVTGSTAGFRVLAALANDFLGCSVRNAGDVNGDGVSDIIVGAYGADYTVVGSDRGAAYIIFGNRTRTFKDIDLSTMVAGQYTGFRIVGQVSSSTGAAVSTAGDVNGDGISDMIVGAPTLSTAGAAKINSGVTYVIYGTKYTSASPPADFMLSSISTFNVVLGYRIIGAAANDKSGYSVSTAGDVNSDGFADIIVGAPYATVSRGVSTSGVAYIIFGQSGNHPEVLLATMKTSMFTGYRILGPNAIGYSVCTAGDVNGDGVADVVVGTSGFVAYGGNFIDMPSSQPSAQPSSRPSRQPSSQPSSRPTSQPSRRPSAQPSRQPSARPSGQPSSQPTGQPTFQPSTHMVAVGDVDPSTMSKSVGFRIQGSTEATGYAVSNAGDVNHDGIDDVIIGSLFEMVSGYTNVGCAYVVFGRNHSFLSNLNVASMVTGRYTGFRILGSATDDYTGTAVSGAGDINNDGVDDVIVGQTSTITLGAAGISYVIFGRRVTSSANAFTDIYLAGLASGPTTMIRLTGASTGDFSGSAVSDAGDVNGDGIDDVIVASLYATPAAGRAAAGISYVIFGSSSPVDVQLNTIATGSTNGFRILGVSQNDACGAALSAAGDVNDDGVDDVIVASYLATSPNGASSGVSYIVFGIKVTGARSDVDLATMPNTITTGYRINGAMPGDSSGISVGGAGDVNGDGLDDLIIGAFWANPTVGGTTRTRAGISYVMFGRRYSAANQQLSSIVSFSSFGFRILGATAGDQTGQAVSGAGDINNDGFADVIVGSRQATLVNGITTAGVAYVIFGRSGVLADVDLLTMKSTMTTGFRILGTTGSQFQAGAAVSYAGDVNGDGNDDVIVGAASYIIYGGNFINQPSSRPSSQPSRQPSSRPSAQPSRQPTAQPTSRPTRQPSAQPTSRPTRQPSAQPSGQPTFQPSLHMTEIYNVDLGALPKSTGFRIKGTGQQTVTAVSPAGDVNGDGIADLIVGSPDDAANSAASAGIAYVVFSGNTTFKADVDLSAMVTGRYTGFRILGASSNNFNGNSVSGAGDVNGDGVDDVITGAYQVSGATGVSYVIYGRKVTSSANALADISLSSMVTGPAAGFRIFGAVINQRSGFSVNKAGDVNGDGVGDLIIGAPFSASVSGLTTAGIAYVVFGNRTTADVYLANIVTGSKAGFRILGAAQGNVLGTSVSGAGDVNGDGVDDVIVGAYRADPTGTRTQAGTSYVILGSKTTVSYSDMDMLTMTTGPTTGFRIKGAAALDLSGYSVSDAGDVNGDGKADVIVGAYQAAPQVSGVYRSAAGIAFVVMGSSSVVDVDLSLVATGSAAGFRILGAAPNDNMGKSVHGAGDVNGDGFADVIVGALFASSPTTSQTGAAYVIFGRSNPFVDVDLKIMRPSLSTGFYIFGAMTNDISGFAVSSAGDVNNDGVDDVLVGPAAYVIYGKNFIDEPSSQPSSRPSAQPSRQPSGQPSRQPSAQPSRQPSRQPSGQPSRQPSRQPTSQPSRQPSSQPSAKPSAQPSQRPSCQPTCVPTSQPSGQPSTHPSTVTPTSRPSTQPSRQPSAVPSSQPSTQPTVQPSGQPSVAPSSQPSTQPTVQPTLQPNSSPTVSPSVQPSGQPSSQPTVMPSSQPSGQPTVQPTRQPISSPTAIPSAQPSEQPTGVPSSQPSSTPSSQPSSWPTARPSSLPSRQPSGQPSSLPSSHPSALPTLRPSAQPVGAPSGQPSAQPSGQPSEVPSGQPTGQPRGVPSAQPTGAPSSQPSSRPSRQPTCAPSTQPSGQPSAQPSAQPVARPSDQPSVQPSRQPTAVPSSRPTGKPPTGEWVTTVPTVLELDKVAFIGEKVWACGGSGDATCVLADYTTGDIYTQYNFGWDTITYVIDIADPSRVYISGRTTGAASTTSEVANCAIKPVQLTCTVKSFLNTNFLGSSYSPLTQLIVFVGKSYSYGTATVVDSTSAASERNYYYTASGMTSMALLCAASPPNFVGAFVAGTGVSGTATNRIIAGWVRLSTGDLSAMYIVPTTGPIVNSANLVAAMVIEPIGPDLFIAGALDLGSSVNAGAWGYVLRTNALYKTVQYGVRYVPQQTGGRRLSVDGAILSSVVKGIARVGTTMFVVINFAELNGTSLCLIKADAATGEIIKQATISSHNASIACTDITTAALLLDITCTVQRSGALSQQAQLISVDRELSFTRLPSGFKRGGNSTFVVEVGSFKATGLTATKQSTTIETTDSTVVISNEVPTMRPTLEPSVHPSIQPSDVPSSLPSSRPTSAPSVSARPTSTPSTSGPTNTYKPSRTPTIRPTISPSVTITSRPSKKPTSMPTTRPTVKPSTMPSTAPTAMPSLVPTVKPTVVPSRRPVAEPSAVPSVVGSSIGYDDDRDGAAAANTPQYVIAVSVTGGVLLIGLCAFLFYKRHELRVKDVHGKFFKVAPGPTLPMWLPDETPDREDARPSVAPTPTAQKMSVRRAGSLAMFDSDSDSEASESSGHDSADSMPFFSGRGAFIDGPVARGRVQSEAGSVFVSEETESRQFEDDDGEEENLSAPSDMSDFDSSVTDPSEFASSHTSSAVHR